MNQDWYLCGLSNTMLALPSHKDPVLGECSLRVNSSLQTIQKAWSGLALVLKQLSIRLWGIDKAENRKVTQRLVQILLTVGLFGSLALIT